MAVITVSKRYASGGVELAKELAVKMGYRYVDRAVIEMLTQELGISPSEASALQDVENPRLLKVVDKLSGMVIKGLAGQSTEGTTIGRLDYSAFIDAAKSIIRRIAGEDNVVMVGWGGQLILADLSNAIHLRFTAPKADRAARVAAQTKCTAAALAEVERWDRRSRRFIHYYWRQEWNDALLYDLVLNTSRLDLDTCREMTLALLRLSGLA